MPPHTPTAIASALLDVYTHYDQALHKASVGRQRVLELFQVDRMVRDYDALFSQH